MHQVRGVVLTAYTYIIVDVHTINLNYCCEAQGLPSVEVLKDNYKVLKP